MPCAVAVRFDLAAVLASAALLGASDGAMAAEKLKNTGILLDKVAKDPYPSTTMMDLIEELLTPEDVPAYAAVLMDKIRKDQFPSLDLMTRVRDLG